jgi:hypothetical protein
MKKFYIVSCLVILFSGCATVRTDFAPLRFDAAAKTRGDILLTTGELESPYTEIGVIFVKGRYFTSFEKLMDKMKEKACEAGADAVIKIAFGNRYGYHFRHSCRVAAVSFKK